MSQICQDTKVCHQKSRDFNMSSNISHQIQIIFQNQNMCHTDLSQHEMPFILLPYSNSIFLRKAGCLTITKYIM